MAEISYREALNQALFEEMRRDESVVLFDELGAGEGDLVGLVEGREATAPFWPKKVPCDSYNAAILDEVDFDPVL